MMKEMTELLKEIRKKKPLILNLSNEVTLDFIANVLLAIGAAPIMTSCDRELEELIRLSQVININLGTLSDAFIQRCHTAIRLAKDYQKPVILDPVGSGASSIRTNTSKEMLKFADIVRGNASEIMSLQQENIKTLGVESIHDTSEGREIAIALAKKHCNTIVISGPIDFVTDGLRHTDIPFGSSLMSRVTGMGCALTATIAAFKSICDDSFDSTMLAISYYGLCGQLAENKTKYPGSFRTAFIDELYKADLPAMEALS